MTVKANILTKDKGPKYKSKLKKYRIAMGFTQSELADLSGINIKSIASYEQFPERINKASVETIAKLADSLGCNLDDLIEDEYFNF